MAPFAKLFHDLEFNILVADARGHGTSEGNYIGFGWHERMDYIQWINQVIEKYGKNCEIVLFGISMGGATVLNVSGEGLPKQVKAIIEDCGFSSVEEEITYQLKTMYKLPKFPLVQITSLITKLKAGYWFEEASSLEQVKKIKYRHYLFMEMLMTLFRLAWYMIFTKQTLLRRNCISYPGQNMPMLM